MRTSILMNSRLRHRHRRRVRAGPGLVYLQRRSHEHVQPQHQHPQDAGQVPGRLGGPQRVRRRGPARRCSTSSTRRSRRSCCRVGADGTVAQATESVIGPYELHDFFLFHFLRYGAPPEKILFLAEHAAVRPRLHAGRDAPLAAGVRAALLRQPVQALVPAGRPEGRLDQPVAARRLAHAERRRGGAVAASGWRPDRRDHRPTVSICTDLRSGGSPAAIRTPKVRRRGELPCTFYMRRDHGR